MLTTKQVNDLALKMETEAAAGLAEDLRCATDPRTQRQILLNAAEIIERHGYDDSISATTAAQLREAANE